MSFNPFNRGSTLRFPVDLLARIRDERAQKLNDDQILYLSNDIARFFNDHHLLFPNGRRGIAYNIFPQLIGEHVIQDIVQEDRQFAVKKLLDMRSVQSLSDVKEMLYRLFQAFNMLEGRSYSDNDQANVQSAEVLFSARPDYAARTVLGYDSDIPDGEHETFIHTVFGRRPHNKKTTLVSFKDDQIAYAGSCAAHAMVYGLKKMFPEMTLQERHYQRINAWCSERDGVNPFLMQQMLTDFSYAGPFALINRDLGKFFRICILNDGFVRKSDIEFERHVRGTPTNEEMNGMIKTGKKRKGMTVYLVLSTDPKPHWYVYASEERNTWTNGWSMPRLAKPSSCHYDDNKEEEPREIIMDRTPYIEENKKKEKEILKRLIQGNSVITTGPGGSGKSESIKAVLKDYPGKAVYTSWTANLARGTEGLKGNTLHALFNSFEQDEFGPLYKGPDLDLLVVDEIGNNQMHWLGYIETALQRFNRTDKFFGGVTVWFLGDFMQLRPIMEAIPDYPFYHHSFKHALIRNNHFTFDAPLRYLEKTNSETKDFIHGLDALRFGRTTNFIKQKFVDNHITIEEEYFSHYKNKAIDQLPLFMTWTKKDCAKIHNYFIEKEISPRYNQDVLRHINNAQYLKGDPKNYGEMNSVNLKKDMPYMVSNNSAMIYENGSYKIDQKINNGTKLVLKGETPYGLEFYCKDLRKNIILAPFVYLYKKKLYAIWGLKAWIARTIDGSQGRTEESISLYLPCGKKGLKEHSVYMAISRARSLIDFKWFGPKKMKLDECVAADWECMQFHKDPYLITDPRVFGVIKNTDDKPKRLLWNTLEDRQQFEKYRVREPMVEGGKGVLKDRFYCENSRLFANSIFYDNETLIRNQIDKILMAYGIATQYYRGGVIQKILQQGCKWREDHKQGYFTRALGNAEENFCEWIYQIITRMKDNNQKQDPLCLLGFNLHNFDLLMILKDMIEKRSEGEFIVEITKTNGTQNKGIRVVYFYHTKDGDLKKRAVLKTHDIMHVMGVGSLDAHCKAWLMPLYKEKLPEFIKAILTREEQALRDNVSTQDFLSKAKQEMDADVYGNDSALKEKKMAFEAAKISYEMMSRQTENVFDAEQVYNRKLKKGSAPLKLMNEYAEESKFKALVENPIVNMEEILLQPDGWIRCFHDGRRDHGKLHFKDLTQFREYNLLQEIEDYAMDDINVTVLLYRIMNNVIYECAADHSSFRHKSGHNGCRLSVLQFLTTCQLTGYLSAKFLPKDMIEMDAQHEEIVIDQPLYDERMYKLLRQVTAGKVLPRVFSWESDPDDPEDYCVYLDISGMYATAMRDYEYPYGKFYVLQSPKDDAILKKMVKDLNAKKFDKKCWAGMVTYRLHHLELDPPVGRKQATDGKRFTDCGNRIIYGNDGNGPLATNICCQDIVEAGGKIEKIHYVIMWENQGKILSPYMSYLAIGKATSSGAKKAFYKLMQNAEYGNMGKRNYDTSTYMVPQKALPDFMEAVSMGDFDGTFSKIGQEDKSTYIFNLKKQDFGLSSRPTQMSTFVLAYSHHMMNHAIKIMFGDDRHNLEKALELMSKYGDTDSIVVPRKALQKLIDYDKEHPDEPNILIYQDTSKMDKMGKFADELADALWDEYDIAKEENRPHDLDGMDKSFPDFESGFVCRVYDIRDPQPKSYACMYKHPPGTYEGISTTKDNFKRIPFDKWITRYKAKCKGISKGAELSPSDGTAMYAKMGNNQDAYKVMKHCLTNKIEMKTFKRDCIGKYLDKTPEQKRQKMFSNFACSLGRGVFKPKNPNDRQSRIERDFNGTKITVPPGFQFIPYSKQQVKAMLDRTQCPECDPEDPYCCMFKQFT